MPSSHSPAWQASCRSPHKECAKAEIAFQTECWWHIMLIAKSVLYLIASCYIVTVSCPLFFILNQQEEECSRMSDRVAQGKVQACYKETVNQEHKMRGLEPCKMRLWNTYCYYLMIVLIQPDSLLLPALTPPCKPSPIYCTVSVALEKFLHPTEKTGRTARDYSAVPQMPCSVSHSTDLSLGIQGLTL